MSSVLPPQCSHSSKKVRATKKAHRAPKSSELQKKAHGASKKRSKSSKKQVSDTFSIILFPNHTNLCRIHGSLAQLRRSKNCNRKTSTYLSLIYSFSFYNFGLHLTQIIWNSWPKYSQERKTLMWYFLNSVLGCSSILRTSRKPLCVFLLYFFVFIFDFVFVFCLFSTLYWGAPVQL